MRFDSYAVLQMEKELYKVLSENPEADDYMLVRQLQLIERIEKEIKEKESKVPIGGNKNCLKGGYSPTL